MTIFYALVNGLPTLIAGSQEAMNQKIQQYGASSVQVFQVTASTQIS